MTGGMGQSRGDRWHGSEQGVTFFSFRTGTVLACPGPQACQSNALLSTTEWPQTQNPLASASSVAGMTSLHYQAQLKVGSLSL